MSIVWTALLAIAVALFALKIAGLLALPYALVHAEHQRPGRGVSTLFGFEFPLLGLVVLCAWSPCTWLSPRLAALYGGTVIAVAYLHLVVVGGVHAWMTRGR